MRRARSLARGLLGFLIVTAIYLDAAQVEEARVTHVVNDVKLASAQAAPHPVTASKEVRDGDAIATGAASRSELILADQTIIRLGPKTAITFSEGTHSLNLSEGAMLFQIPKSTGKVRIKTDAITTASTGATGIIERHGQFYVKVLVLEGTVRCYLTNRLGESLLVRPGQILITKPDKLALPEPADFDIAREMKTCLLVRQFQPLPSQGLIELEEQKQSKLIAKGKYIPSNLVIFGRGTLVNLVNPPSTTPPSKPATNTGHQSNTP